MRTSRLIAGVPVLLIVVYIALSYVQVSASSPLSVPGSTAHIPGDGVAPAGENVTPPALRPPDNSAEEADYPADINDWSMVQMCRHLAGKGGLPAHLAYWRLVLADPSTPESKKEVAKNMVALLEPQADSGPVLVCGQVMFLRSLVGLE